ncbi:MAG TPA: hypothetical protein VNW15_14965 [Rhizomicrobium sp.]|nr:hypothetical protein [Rhizomicrobium sp.]
MLPTANRPTIVSSHADYRRSDYIFPRAQSRVMNDREWERREAPLHSWTKMLFPVLSALTAAAALAILH